MFVENIHIGSVIALKIKEKGINRSELARRINKTRQNIDSIVKRKSLDIDLLISISNALAFNFLNIYLLPPTYKDIQDSATSISIIQNQFLIEKVEIIEKIIEDKNKIIDLLESKR